MTSLTTNARAHVWSRWWTQRMPWLTEITVSPAEAEAFDRHGREAYARSGPTFLLLLLAAVLLWWPLDPIVFADRPAVIERYAVWRGLLVLWLGALWLMVPPARIEKNPTHLHVLALYPGLALTGWCFGGIGGFDGPWFYYLTFAPILSTLLLEPLGTRAAVTGLGSGVVTAAFLLGAPPGTASHPDALSALSFLAFTTALGIALGHLTWRLARANFARKLRIAANEAALRAMKDQLQRQVAQQTQELRRLASHLDELREAERARMARELHDELGQELTALRYNAALAQVHAAPGSPVEDALTQLQRLLERTTETTRRLLQGLRPKVLDEIGLIAAARWLARGVSARTGLAITVVSEADDAAIEADVSRAAFRIIQEALTNVERHADATVVHIGIERTSSGLSVCISDDGVGLPPNAEERGGFGLLGIRERAIRFGGRATFERSGPGGTRITVWLRPREEGAA